MGFENPTAAFELAKWLYVLDRAATMNGRITNMPIEIRIERLSNTSPDC
jgi:hypothetical protein